MCVEDIDGTCPAGGTLDATLTLKEGALFATLEGEGTITSPAIPLSINVSIDESGTGPIYIGSSSADNSEFISEGWTVTITGLQGAAAFEVTGEVQGLIDEDILPAGTVKFLVSIPDLILDVSTSILSQVANGSANVTPPNIDRTRTFFPGQALLSTSEVQSQLVADLVLQKLQIEAEGELSDNATVDYCLNELAETEGELNNTYTDKVGGEFGDFYCIEKLYPSGDSPALEGFGSFVTPTLEGELLYEQIDEGVYQGVLKDKGDSVLLSDDFTSYIHPNTIHTNGLFQYNCQLTDLNVRPDDTAIRFRASTPMDNYESKVAPLYTVYNIKLSDPSGNLVVKYNDVQIKGDGQFATYSSLPETNILTESYDWERRNYPHMNMVSGYQLSLSVRAVALDDPFDPGFDIGFEENYIIPEIFYASGNNYLALDGQPLSTQESRFLNPTDGFKLSAIEICSSGGYGTRREDYLPFVTPVREIGYRLERCIKPTFMPNADFDSTIYPSVTSIWQSESATAAPFDYTNEDDCGTVKLVEALREKDANRFVCLTDQEGGGIADSGKLVLRFGGCTSPVDEITDGAFDFAFDQSSNKRWWSPSGAFNTENRNSDGEDSIFYRFETITLKVLAKKENVGSRDYHLDVVGYSDDKLLNVTSASGGFLQNPSGICLNDLLIASEGNHPVISGFYSDDQALSELPLSALNTYYEASGNDHYKLTPYPMVTGTTFEWYEVPLEILDPEVRHGLATDNKQSPKLENIYLDIFPIPSGACIAYAELCVRYAPQNALNIVTQGGERLGKTQDGRSEAALFPVSRGVNDDILNTGSGYQPISSLEGLPHQYDSPNTIKTNYARRWRGAEGTVAGPYDPDMFAFGFENPTLDYPFLSGYYKFGNVVDGFVQSYELGPTDTPSGLGTSSGELIGDPQIYQNVGWRFASGTLFEDHLPGFSGNYTSTDWTALSNGATTFVGNPMYGKIADAFDRVVRVSGEAGEQNIDFGTIDTVSGFAIFLRFTPDSNVSGVGYNLFESGVLASQWDTPTDMGWALGFEEGFLTGYAQDDAGNVISIQDTQNYDDYTYPLSVLLTYNDNYSKKLKLYTDSDDAAGVWDTLRDVSPQFERLGNSAPVVLGYCAGSGVGMNMLVSEFGISAYSSGVDTLYGSGTNIVEANADWTYKQVTAEKFLENVRVKYFNPGESADKDRYKLWDRVNEDTYNDWAIGAFKFCPFGPAFDQWQTRPNAEQIVFQLSHHGSGYSADHDLALLPTIDSGVAYHTQMENDFLRFHLSDVPDNFYAVNKRISKNIPCGYKFSENAIVVESVIQHTASGLEWPACEGDNPETGPKLIVSLYTKSQHPYWEDREPNWGLVNRKVHFLTLDNCIERYDSTFTYEDICDETEEWAIFPKEPRLKDFKERYFSDDVNDMFVQYDLVYPSGRAFESRLQLHTSHVRMANANILSLDNSGVMNLNMSGAFPADGSINMNIGGFAREENETLPLTIQVPFPYDVLQVGGSGFTLNVSGAFTTNNSMNLFIPPQSGYSFFNLNVEGFIPPNTSGQMNLAMPKTYGRIDVGDSGIFSDGSNGMSLSILNSEMAVSPSGPYLNMNLFASENTAVQDSLFLSLFNNLQNYDSGLSSGVINMAIFGKTQVEQTRFQSEMPLFINAPNILTEQMPLYLQNPRVEAVDSGQMSLFTASYPVGSKGTGSINGLWDGYNYGTGIEIEDNPYAYVDVSNEIRGVDLAGYGACGSDSPSKAIDKALVTDCTVWREETCNDAGAFRAKDTYTNSGAINIQGGIGYSGDYYSIRKYTQLLPSLGYDTVMTIKTGSTERIPVPRDYEEWEYGMCGPDWYPDGSGCCTEDCDQNIVFSGVKIVSDDSMLATDPELLLASGRQEDAKFGSVVSVKGDLMAISAPNLTIPDFDTNRGIEDDPVGERDPGQVDVSGAGAVFLYRRGTDVAGKKAGWTFEDQLMLPSGFRKDYIQYTSDNLLTFDQFSISGNKWQIGQEGRQFGESMDMCSSGNRETLVIGAPRAKWEREFVDITTSGIPTAALVVADLFEYDKVKLRGLAAAAGKFNVLYKYFSAPWSTPPNEWYAEINPKILIMQLTYSDKNYPQVPRDESNWFIHKYIPRLDDIDLLVDVGTNLIGAGATLTEYIEAAQPVVFNTQLSGVVESFDTAFPKSESVIYSGIPAILGMFKENTGSTAGALQYTDSNGDLIKLYDAIEEHYLSWSYNSGVTDFVQNIQQSGHINSIEGKSEDAYLTTTLLLQDTFDSGRLSTTFTNSTLNRNFIASGIGQEWGETHGTVVSQFQVPPASGGRVYIFEKERDVFNCIQVINSPDDEFLLDDTDIGLGDTYGFTPNDRFGHSVSISANSEVITIGNPFKPTPVRIYERNEEENQKVYDNVRDWAEQNGRTLAIEHYNTIVAQSGFEAAKVSTYDFLEQQDKFAFRNDVNFWGALPSPYNLSFKYNYSDIQYVGTNKWLAGTFAPTSRLGWSTSVNDNGDVAVFGAPTDSFNVFDDVNVWGTGINSWASYVHGGAVRVFESRKYYPHSGVVELGRFGNLDRATHKEERDAGYYDQWDLIFGSGADGTTDAGKSFRRTDFSEIEIPRDAGLAFITTPELDAASDEMIQNIKDWLALGDRNLVLVGNDPVWEDGGLYKESNDVINKILGGLDSRMRILAAKDETYASQGNFAGGCVSEEDVLDDKYNVTPVIPPAYSAGFTIQEGNFYGKGFGDIRIDLSQDGLENYQEFFNCPEGITCDGSETPVINDKCEFPLEHLGDLRATWKQQCVKTTPKSCKIITYQNNWPFQFGNKFVDCDQPPTGLFNKPKGEPVPVLTTAEHLPDKSWYRPATSGKFCEYETIYEWRIRQAGSTTTRFAENQLDEVSFNIQEDSDSDASGNFLSFEYDGDFFDPSAKNGRDGLLQAVGTSFYPEDEEREETRVIYPISILGLVESGKNDAGNLNNSRVYLMASQWSEDDNSRGIDDASTNDDKNTEFYLNMIRKDCDNSPRGIQINGFSNQSSLSGAYSKTVDSDTAYHGLADKISYELAAGNGGYFLENKDTADLNELVDFAWIVQPEDKPSDLELSRIQNWLNLGNKKLIVTYNGVYESDSQETAENVDYLCSGINVSSRPFYLPKLGEYYRTGRVITGYDRTGPSFQEINLATDSVSGCDDGYDFSNNYNFATSMSGVDFNPKTKSKAQEGLDGSSYQNGMEYYVPLSGGQDYENILWHDESITEKYTVYPTNRYKIDAEALIDFPVEKGSGYRLFVNWVSETNSEKFAICGDLQRVTADPSDDEEQNELSGLGDNQCGSIIELSKTTTRTEFQQIIDIVAQEDELTLSLNTDIWSNSIPSYEIIDGVLPSTPRFISVSGCPLPIITETVITTTSGKYPIGQIETCEWIVNPAQSGSIPGVSRPVFHNSQDYCGDVSTDKECRDADFGSTLIQDGPVVVAEEVESFSSFPAGRRRSHIIVISDSTMIQGQCPQYRGGESLSLNQSFVRGLYPTSPEGYDEPQDDGGLIGDVTFENLSNTRNWYFSQKLRSPEVGSPAKYNAASGSDPNLNGAIIPTHLWGGNGNGLLSEFSDSEDYVLDPTVNTGRPQEVIDYNEQLIKLEQFNDNALADYGMWPKFSGDVLDIISDNPTPPEYYNEILGELPPIDPDFAKSTIVDAGIGGGMSDLMKGTNFDYLDLDVFHSGCRGDLFGYSVDLSQDTLVVGTPFNAFVAESAISGVSGIVQWHEIVNGESGSGLAIARDGGAGAAFTFDRTGSGENLIAEFLPWEWTQKIKPTSLNVGIYDFSPDPENALTNQRGTHQIEDPSYIVRYGKQSDNFGVAVSIDCDMIVVGAPNHDFETLHHHIYSGAVVENGLNTAFTRKGFNAEFDIPQHSYYDLTVGSDLVDSGVVILNGGAVYNYRNQTDFSTLTKSWTFADKLHAQSGYKDRVQSEYQLNPSPPFDIQLAASGNESDNFGKSVSIDRAFRGDGDYTMVAGSPNHDFPVSGDHPTSGLAEAGAAYTFDAMLRGQIPSIANSGGWLEAHVFGNKKDRTDTDRLETRVYQNTSGDSLSYQVSGLIFTNYNGDVFLEVSGYDPSVNGFIAHRPYVESIEFNLHPAIQVADSMIMNISGSPVDFSGNMNLSMLGADSAIVYNNVGMNTFGVVGYASGEPSGMFLNIAAPSGPVTDSLNLNVTSTQSSGSLPLRIRGF